MSGCCSTLIRRLAGGRRELSWLNSNRRHSPINILNDDVLLNIFHLYRLADEHDDGFATIFVWRRQRWWYKLAHICRQWRNVILESPSRLDLHLLCTNGVPVADMLAHSPPLPLTIYYHNAQEITTEDESGILLALSHRDRVRHIYLRHIYFWHPPNVEKFVTAMDGQFPTLERMNIESRTEVFLRVTFQAPKLRHLRLWTAASLPDGSPFLTTAAGLVTLELLNIPASYYFPPSYIFTRLALMLQLEKLSIIFQFPTRNHDVERQLRQTPDMTTLPNLRWLVFRGTVTHLEGLLARISAPSLDKLHVFLIFNQLSFTFPRLLQFMQTSEALRFTAVQVTLGRLAVSLHAVPWKGDTPLLLQIWCGLHEWQVASAVQFLNTFLPVLSVVEKVTFSYDKCYRSSEWHNNVDRRQWRELLRPFAIAKTIHVQDHLVSKIIRSLPSEDGEPPLELLPNLEEVGYSGGSDARDALIRLLNERQVAGRPVSLRLVDPSMFDVPPVLSSDLYV